MPCEVSCEGTEKRRILFGKQGRLPEGKSLEIWEHGNIRRCGHDGCVREETATEVHRASLGAAKQLCVTGGRPGSRAQHGGPLLQRGLVTSGH